MAMFYDKLSCRYFVSTEELIRSTWDQCMSDRKDPLTANEFYNRLDGKNLSRVEIFDQIRWNPKERFDDCVELIQGNPNVMKLHNYTMF